MILVLQISSTAAHWGVDNSKGVLPSGSALNVLSGTYFKESDGEKPDGLLPESMLKSYAEVHEDPAQRGDKVPRPESCAIDINSESMSLSPRSIRPTVMEPSPTNSTSDQIVLLAAYNQQRRPLPDKNQLASAAGSAQAAQEEDFLHQCPHATLCPEEDADRKCRENAGKSDSLEFRDDDALPNLSELCSPQNLMEIDGNCTETGSVRPVRHPRTGHPRLHGRLQKLCDLAGSTVLEEDGGIRKVEGGGAGLEGQSLYQSPVEAETSLSLERMLLPEIHNSSTSAATALLDFQNDHSDGCSTPTTPAMTTPRLQGTADGSISGGESGKCLSLVQQCLASDILAAGGKASLLRAGSEL
jgi:hypothetical protein